MSRRAVALLLGLLVAAGAVPARATASPAAPIIEPSFAPEADARVVKASPDTNFGTQTVLEADNSPVVESLLRFTVSGISGAVSRARLRLFVTDSSSNGPALYRT